MREIIFRAWDRETKTMNTISYIDFYKKEYGLKELNWHRSFENCDIMQYTGLKDKNGKEIYEGDIVKEFHENKNLEIKWDAHHCAFTASNRWVEWLRGYGNSGNPFYAGNCEVIGNIYENPELLSKE